MPSRPYCHPAVGFVADVHVNVPMPLVDAVAVRVNAPDAGAVYCTDALVLSVALVTFTVYVVPETRFWIVVERAEPGRVPVHVEEPVDKVPAMSIRQPLGDASADQDTTAVDASVPRVTARFFGVVEDEAGGGLVGVDVAVADSHTHRVESYQDGGVTVVCPATGHRPIMYESDTGTYGQDLSGFCRTISRGFAFATVGNPPPPPPTVRSGTRGH